MGDGIFYIYKAHKLHAKAWNLWGVLEDFKRYYSNTKALPARQGEHMRILAGDQVYIVFDRFKGMYIK